MKAAERLDGKGELSSRKGTEEGTGGEYDSRHSMYYEIDKSIFKMDII